MAGVDCGKTCPWNSETARCEACQEYAPLWAVLSQFPPDARQSLLRNIAVNLAFMLACARGVPVVGPVAEVVSILTRRPM